MCLLAPEKDIWKLKLTDFLLWSERERNNQSTGGSINKRLSHIRGFLNYAWRCGKTDRNVLDGFQVQDGSDRVKPDVLTVDEAAQMVLCCLTETVADRRDRIVILLLYGCGLRTGELCDLRIQDTNTEKKELFIRAAKGDIQRMVPIPAGIVPELLQYLLDRNGKRGVLIRTDKKKRLSHKRVCDIVKLAAERAKINRPVVPKMLRHSYASHLMDAGVNLAIIAKLLGHRSPRETGIYLHAMPDRANKAVDHTIVEQLNFEPHENGSQDNNGSSNSQEDRS
jgi:site-specific recombinase XerD